MSPYRSRASTNNLTRFSHVQAQDVSKIMSSPSGDNYSNFKLLQEMLNCRSAGARDERQKPAKTWKSNRNGLGPNLN